MENPVAWLQRDSGRRSQRWFVVVCWTGRELRKSSMLAGLFRARDLMSARSSQSREADGSYFVGWCQYTVAYGDCACVNPTRSSCTSSATGSTCVSRGPTSFTSTSDGSCSLSSSSSLDTKQRSCLKTFVV